MIYCNKFKSFALAIASINNACYSGADSIFEFKSPPETLESKAGYFVLEKALEVFNGQSSAFGTPLVITRTDFGKPYFENSALEFSISHSGDLVAACISECQVGIDIEQKKQRNFTRYAKKLCSSGEYRDFIESADKASFFYELWCKKESYLKCKGTGIRESMSDVFIDSRHYSIVFVPVSDSLCCCVCLRSAQASGSAGARFETTMLKR